MGLRMLLCVLVLCCFFFFFQAEDGIRDLTVSGVQTCALPILRVSVLSAALSSARDFAPVRILSGACTLSLALASFSAACGGATFTSLTTRSEERRVGKEGRSRWSPYH